MYELNKEAFGRFLAGLRKEQGLTQRQLAEKLFVSDKAVSKWERGLSIPDTALLVPLADALGVTVTELLLCRRCPPAEPLAPDTVDEAVRAAIEYPRLRAAERAWQAEPLLPKLWYFLCLAVGGAGLWANWRLGCLGEALPICFLLAAVFGGYFWLLAPVRLPDFYDRYELGFFWDYIVRMNIPGVAFNNRNWPHILRVLRVWACVVMALCPPLNIPLARLLSPLALGRVWLFLLLGGLFLPVYIAGRRV